MSPPGSGLLAVSWTRSPVRSQRPSDKWPLRWVLAWGALMFGLAFHAPALQAHDNSVDDRAIKAISPERIESMRRALIQQIWDVPWSELLTWQPTRTTDHYTQSPADALPTGLQKLDRIEQVVTVMSEPEVGGSEWARTARAGDRCKSSTVSTIAVSASRNTR